MARILIVEDDPAVRDLLRRFIEGLGYDVAVASDGAEGVTLAPRVDLVLLDVGLPVIGGLGVAEALRKEYPALPIIMVTGRAEQGERLAGFDAGADDYVTKPFDVLELGARIRAMLRRSGYRDEVTHGELHIDSQNREVSLAGVPIAVSRLEFDLLELLARHPGMVFTRERLIAQVWGNDFEGDERTIDVRIAGLRRKLQDPARAPRFISAVRGIGYRFIRQN